jgi:hypothetical protein
MTFALVLLIAFGSSPAHAACGDVNQDSVIDISDMTTLINHLLVTGEPLLDTADANIDGCHGVDIGDLNTLVGYLFVGLTGPCISANCTLYPNGSISLHGVVNGNMSEVYVGDTVRLRFTIENGFEYFVPAVTNGFRAYSPDGATWDVIDLRAFPFLDSTQIYFLDIIEYPGSPYPGDTVGFGGFGTNGLTPGFSEVSFEIVIGPFDAADAGKTLCIDSSHYLVDNPWLWCSRDRHRLHPMWTGPYCFDIVDPPETNISLHDVTGEIAPGVVRTDVPVSFDFLYDNGSDYNITGFTNGYRVYSPDGANVSIQAGEAIGSLWTDSVFNDAFSVQYFGPGPDTAGFGGVTILGDGFPAHTQDVAFRLTLNPLDSADNGKHVCVDSSFYPPAGHWLWGGPAAPSFVPGWDGPHCYEIQWVDDPPVALDVPDSVFITVYENTDDVPYEVIEVATEFNTDPVAFTANIVEDFGPFVLSHAGDETPDKVYISALPQGLTAGRYVNTVEFTSDSADNSPQYTYVVLDVLPEPETGFLVDGFFGTYGQQMLKAGPVCWFDLRVINNSEATFGGISNGIEISSPDGAMWTESWPDTNISLAPFFDLGVYLNQFSNDGQGADTLGFAGVAIYEGLPPGTDLEPYSGYFGPIDGGSVGKTICVDSSWYHPANLWVWSVQGTSEPVIPDWSGEQCLEVYAPQRMISLDGNPYPSDTINITTEVGVDILDYTLYIESIDGMSTPVHYYTVTDVPWLQPKQLWFHTFNPPFFDVLVGSMDTGTYHGHLLVDAPEATNTPWQLDVVLTIVPATAGADSLIFPSSATTGLCGVTQEVAIKASQILKGAAIPIAVPEGGAVTDVSFDGHYPENWDFNFVEINNDEGYVFVALANSFGDVIPEGEVPVFTMTYNAGSAECMTPGVLRWDTTLSDDPSRALLFSDADNLDVQPGFDKYRDSVVLPGYLPGDFDGNDAVNINDLTGMVSYMFESGPPPCVLNALDCNGTCTGPNIADMTYLVDFLFQSGDAPVCGCLNKMATPKLWPGASVAVLREDASSVITLTSDIDLHGVQLELTGVSARAQNLLGQQFELLQHNDDGTLLIGLLDLEGERMIAAGEQKLIRLEGGCEIISAIASNSKHEDIVLTVGEPATVPYEYGLHQNYPNPFNPSTEISFTLAEAGHVRLEVFNVMGQKIATLVDGYRTSGPHSVTWNGHTTSGELASSGVYFYRLETGSYADTRKMMLLK